MNEYWAKEELARAYRCIAELWRCRMDGAAMDVEAAGYHAPVVAAAQHFVLHGALGGAAPFEDKPVSVMFAALMLARPGDPAETAHADPDRDGAFRRWTVSETRCSSVTPLAIHYQAPPRQNEDGTRSSSLRSPMLIATDLVAEPRRLLEKIAAVLNVSAIGR